VADPNAADLISPDWTPIDGAAAVSLTVAVMAFFWPDPSPDLDLTTGRRR
jgi:hypothetical protein